MGLVQAGTILFNLNGILLTRVNVIGSLKTSEASFSEAKTPNIVFRLPIYIHTLAGLIRKPTMP